jgi:hypothetical protein
LAEVSCEQIWMTRAHDLEENMHSRITQAARAVGAFMMCARISSITVEKNPLSTV